MADVLSGVLLLLAVAGQAPAADDVERAKRAEARAFEAIDAERWCEAMHLFVEANEAAPSVDLTYNAAQAADLAGDRKQALKLYVDLVGAYPGSERQAQVNERIAELTTLVGKEGEGTPCPAPAPPPDDTADPVTPPAPDEPAPEGGGDDASVLPWAIVGVGGVVTVVGVGLAVAGLLPYVGFLDARDRILAAEAAGVDATTLQKQQRDARASWESWGEGTLFTGVLIAVTGAAITAGGLGWALLTGAPDETAPESAP